MVIELQTIVTKLMEKTKAGKATWQRASLSGNYYINIGESMFAISKSGIMPSWFEIKVSIPNKRDLFYERISIMDLSFKQVDQLYTLASLSASKADEALKKIFEKLDSDDVIG